jgi:hypothetical protein
MLKENNIIVSFIGLCLITGLLSELLFFVDIILYEELIRSVSAIGRIGALILLLRQGTLVNSKPFFQLILVFLGLTVIGALMKIMHWPFASPILLIGLVCTPIIYVLHFLKKHSKHRLDVLKLTWVIIFYTRAIFAILHIPFTYEMQSMEGILFLIMFADFAYKQYLTSKN